jgi:hypothetical protein
METPYMLVVNENHLYFKSLNSVKNWFIKNGVTKNLITVDEDVYSIDKLDEILSLPLQIENESMIERGDDYCYICLEEITFED